jgi:hypothetical protein
VSHTTFQVVGNGPRFFLLCVVAETNLLLGPGDFAESGNDMVESQAFRLDIPCTEADSARSLMPQDGSSVSSL